jgi:hypothetical protein
MANTIIKRTSADVLDLVKRAPIFESVNIEKRAAKDNKAVFLALLSHMNLFVW